MRELKNREKDVKKEKATFYKKHPTKFNAFVEKGEEEEGMDMVWLCDLFNTWTSVRTEDFEMRPY
jgi:hypothetical protein